MSCLLHFVINNKLSHGIFPDPDFLRPKAVENLTAKFDELLSQINVTWMDSSNADDANLTYFITYSVTARNETIFSTNNILSSTFFSYVIQGDFLQAGVIVDITVQACNDYGLGPLSVLPPIQAPGGKYVVLIL